jgi:hypothetical protein
MSYVLNSVIKSLSLLSDADIKRGARSHVRTINENEELYSEALDAVTDVSDYSTHINATAIAYRDATSSEEIGFLYDSVMAMCLEGIIDDVYYELLTRGINSVLKKESHV